jgi:hypothetical protein
MTDDEKCDYLRDNKLSPDLFILCVWQYCCSEVIKEVICQTQARNFTKDFISKHLLNMCDNQQRIVVAYSNFFEQLSLEELPKFLSSNKEFIKNKAAKRLDELQGT